MEKWKVRDLPSDEAARILSVSLPSFRVFLTRTAAVDISARRHGRRWLSPRDLVAIRAAADLAGAAPWAEALPAVAQHLEHPPKPDACLVAEDARTFLADATEAARWAIERGARVLPVGRYAAEIAAACGGVDTP